MDLSTALPCASSWPASSLPARPSSSLLLLSNQLHETFNIAGASSAEAGTTSAQNHYCC